jgi:DNA-binding NtrC family response regulator
VISFSVFVVDDEEVARGGLTMALEGAFATRGFAAAEDALEAMQQDQPDVVLLDIGLPGMSGTDALRLIRERHPDVIVVMITAFEDITTVIAAMKLGAYDYIVKPVHMESLLVTLHNACETIRLRKEVRTLQEKYLLENIPCFIGESQSIQNVMDFVDLVARSPDTPVLLYGETGTGKELVASAIHYKSPNFQGPFVTINCAAIPRDIIESELFGYEKGAFSGARDKGKKGLVEEAAGGTLFLDEIGDLAPEAQAKLLRFLEEGEYYRVGGTRRLKVATRVVSATNRHLEDLIREGRFRQDLYYRLAVIRVEIPCLTKRPDDILPIARHFLVEFSRKFGKTFTDLAPAAAAALLGHSWKGNIRELRNAIERGVLTGRGPLLESADIALTNAPGAIPADTFREENGLPPLTEAGLDLTDLLKTVEKSYIEQALQLAGGNESKAARLLNLNYYTFRHRHKKTR